MTKGLLAFHRGLLCIKKYLSLFCEALLAKKKHFAISVSKVFLNLILFILGALLVGVVLSICPSHGIDAHLLMLAAVSLVYFLIIYDLRKIVYSTDLTPFCAENIKRFKRIGYYMFFMAVFDGVINFKSPSYSGIEIFATQYGSLKGSFLMYVILACIALVLAEIFEKAVEIKDENDLTI